MKSFINVFSRICTDCHIQYGVNKERFGFHKSENGAESSDVMPLYCRWSKAFVGVINTSTFKGRKNSLAVSAHVIVHLLFTSEAANLKDVTVIISEVKRL